MIDRRELIEVAESLRSHLDIVEHFLRYPAQTERETELEILARCNSIEARLAQLRAGVVDRSSHVLGDRS